MTAGTVGTGRLAGTVGAAPTAPAKRHVFEHLGPAPYTYGGMTKRSSSCDHCGTAILFQYWLTATNGKVFKVGCDCIMKAGDSGLRTIVSREKRALDRAKREAKAIARHQRTTALLADPATQASLRSQPHPMGFKDRTTGAALT